MINIEKSLAEKVMFAIHIDRQKEAETYYADYIAHLEFIGKRKDDKLQTKICMHYTNYQVKKAKQYMRGEELTKWKKITKNYTRNGKE